MASSGFLALFCYFFDAIDWRFAIYTHYFYGAGLEGRISLQYHGAG